jgi:hypothetical protein
MKWDEPLLESALKLIFKTFPYRKAGVHFQECSGAQRASTRWVASSVGTTSVTR